MRLEIRGRSATGRRENNQDDCSFGVFRPPRGCLVGYAAVCDGMGGYQGGEFASRAAIETIAARLERPPLRNEDCRAWVNELVAAIQQRLAASAAANPGLKGMGTTMVLALFTETSTWVAHVGDSRAYLVTAESAFQVTEDHIGGAAYLEDGSHSLDELREDPTLRAVTVALSRYLGDETKHEADVREIQHRGDFALVLCSDGVSGSVLTPLVGEQELWTYTAGTRTPGEAVDRLLSFAYGLGSSDNLTAVLVEVGSFPRRGKAPTLPKLEACQRPGGGEGRRRLPSRRALTLVAMVAVVTSIAGISMHLLQGIPLNGAKGSALSVSADRALQGDAPATMPPAVAPRLAATGKENRPTAAGAPAVKYPPVPPVRPAVSTEIPVRGGQVPIEWSPKRGFLYSEAEPAQVRYSVDGSPAGVEVYLSMRGGREIGPLPEDEFDPASFLEPGKHEVKLVAKRAGTVIGRSRVETIEIVDAAAQSLKGGGR